ncbi:MAG: hypothetical protein KC486_28650, partial [Myxococcales bacterium]|nr:hypothetical protein [Myxococcales bacterium]
RVDIYALGVLMYKLLTNKMPFPAPNAYGTLARQLDGEPIPLREAAPEREIPEILERLILKALARDPDQRFQSALELLDALRATADELPSGSRLPRDPRDWGPNQGPSEPTPLTNAQELSVLASAAANSEADRRRLPALVIAITAALFGVIFALAFMRPGQGSSLLSSASERIDTTLTAVATESARERDEATPPPEVRPPPPETIEAPPPAPPEAIEAPTPDKPKARADRLPKTLSEAAVRRRIARQKQAFEKCRERFSGGLNAEHELQVSLLIEGSTGAVKEIKDLNGGAIAQMGACALKAVENTTFPVAAGDTKITHTIRF